MPIQELKNLFPFPKERPNVPLSDHGWFGPEHEELLSQALGPKTNLVLELGSWLGKSTRWIAGHAENATILAVDHWKGLANNSWNPDVSQYLPTLYETFITNCWPLKERLIPIRTDSVSGVKICKEQGLSPDVIFIDASHEYEDVKADVDLVLSLFPNSHICGDDFLWPGVGCAVRESVARGAMLAFSKHNVWWKQSPVFDHLNGTRVTAAES